MGSTRKKIRKDVNLELTALSFAAKQLGTSYGKFVARCTALERQKIIREYKEMMGIEDDGNEIVLSSEEHSGVSYEQFKALHTSETQETNSCESEETNGSEDDSSANVNQLSD